MGVSRLSGKVAVVTGGSGGIGRAIALALAAEGAAVVVGFARSEAAARAVSEEIRRHGGRALAVQADVSRDADVARLVAESTRELGALDVWVNAAGADILTAPTAASSEEAKWDLVMAVDLKGTWLCSRAAAAAMTATGAGAIVNIAWDHVLAGMGNRTAAIYAAAKGGVIALSRCLAREFAPGVRVNVVAPGWIRTKWADGLDAGARDAVAGATPLGRWGLPTDVASAVLFLASAESGFITGETILVGGGVVMG
jgi:3-oxoacyl-[acyl-carrier protein] reductase